MFFEVEYADEPKVACQNARPHLDPLGAVVDGVRAVVGTVRDYFFVEPKAVRDVTGEFDAFSQPAEPHSVHFPR